MVQFEQTVRAVDDLVQQCLQQAGIDAPPVDPAEIAAALGLVAQRDAALAGRGERRTVGGQAVILIRPDERDERECFALAHEIGEEIAAGMVMERLGLSEADGLPWRERLANLFAGRLLCPAHWLAQQTADGVDLRALKATFATASHEVIARGLLSLPVPTMITLLDNAALTARLSNRGHAPPMNDLERSVWQACHTRGSDGDRRHGPLRVQAWAIHEDHWRREILRTTRLDE